jgi:ribosomal protein L34E
MPQTAKGKMSEHHNCIDCGINTHPGASTREEVDNMLRASFLRTEPDRLGSIPFGENTEVYIVRDAVWKAAGMEPYGGCLCINCLESRLGRRLTAKDFSRRHPFNSLPGTQRLLERRGDLY